MLEQYNEIFLGAVKYSLGRRTYMPHLVMDFLRPLSPYFDINTRAAMIRIIKDANNLGDERIDKPAWLNFQDHLKLVDKSDSKVPIIDATDNDFGAVVNCAIRYALSDESAAENILAQVLLVIKYVNSKTLGVARNDIADHQFYGLEKLTEKWEFIFDIIEAEMRIRRRMT